MGAVLETVLLVPAMNTAMWEHVPTARQLATIQGFESDRALNRIKVVPPKSRSGMWRT
jgi:phosphopantothenoylcysteine synthetase/decarboxylase